MTIEQLQMMHQARPFKPFDVLLADGRVLPVEHPEFLSRSPGGRTIGVECIEDDTIEIVDLLLVASLKPQGNGSADSKRRRT